jgi:hypothetical protein
MHTVTQTVAALCTYSSCTVKQWHCLVQHITVPAAVTALHSVKVEKNFVVPLLTGQLWHTATTATAVCAIRSATDSSKLPVAPTACEGQTVMVRSDWRWANRFLIHLLIINHQKIMFSIWHWSYRPLTSQNGTDLTWKITLYCLSCSVQVTPYTGYSDSHYSIKSLIRSRNMCLS